MASVSYRQIAQEHIDFVEAKLEYLLMLEKDEHLSLILTQLKEYYDTHFVKSEQDRLNEIKRLIFTVGKNNQGTAKGKLIYTIYQKLRAGGISPEDAMDEVGEILMGSDI